MLHLRQFTCKQNRTSLASETARRNKVAVYLIIVQAVDQVRCWPHRKYGSHNVTFKTATGETESFEDASTNTFSLSWIHPCVRLQRWFPWRCGCMFNHAECGTWEQDCHFEFTCLMVLLLQRLWKKAVSTLNITKILCSGPTGFLTMKCSVRVAFFLKCNNSGRSFKKSFAHQHFFFFIVEISSHPQIPFIYAKDQFTVAQQAETTVDEHSPMRCMWAHFPDRFPHYSWTAQSAHYHFVGSN